MKKNSNKQSDKLDRIDRKINRHRYHDLKEQSITGGTKSGKYKKRPEDYLEYDEDDPTDAYFYGF